MSKIENNRIYYDPYNEIRCDKFALEKFVKESEEKDKTIADLEAKLAESERKAYSRGHSQRDIDNEIKLNALREDIANKEKRIIELKQQLEEKEKTIENLRIDLKDYQDLEEKISTKYDKVVEKLAEKEKEIENLNNRILISQLQAPKEQILNILGSQCIQYNPTQDKISFALEQLEKVKKLILKECFEVSGRGVVVRYYVIYHIFDNQIEELKKEMEEYVKRS